VNDAWQNRCCGVRSVSDSGQVNTSDNGSYLGGMGNFQKWHWDFFSFQLGNDIRVKVPVCRAVRPFRITVVQAALDSGYPWKDIPGCTHNSGFSGSSETFCMKMQGNPPFGRNDCHFHNVKEGAVALVTG